MLADANAAAVKGYLAAGSGGFIGDKHLGTAVGAFHIIGIPGLVSRSIDTNLEITISCDIKNLHIQYVVVVSISQGRDFFYRLSTAYTTKLTNYLKYRLYLGQQNVEKKPVFAEKSKNKFNFDENNRTPMPAKTDLKFSFAGGGDRPIADSRNRHAGLEPIRRTAASITKEAMVVPGFALPITAQALLWIPDFSGMTVNG